MKIFAPGKLYTEELNENFLEASKFGGNGSDGDLNISAGTTTIDLGGAPVFVMNYLSLSITGTGKLAFSNPHASGTLIIIKSREGVTITSSTVPAIDASGMGAGGSVYCPAGTYGGGPGGQGNTNGYTTPGGVKCPLGALVFNNILLWWSRFVVLSPGAGGGGGVSSGGNYVATGGGGGASPLFDGGTSPSGSNGTAGTGVGAGGGGSRSLNNSYPGGYYNTAGGRGGGAILIECAGNLNFTGEIWSKGLPGANSVYSGQGAGGGGAGGSILIAYNSLVANTGTFNNSGGVGGNATATYVGGAGGASMGGHVVQNLEVS